MAKGNLVAGDSTLLGLEEKRMGPRFKVRGHSGATVSDMFFHLVPLLQKKPDYVILMAGTNNSTEKDADTLVTEIIQLKWFVEIMLPECKVFVSCPTVRVDNNIAKETVLSIRQKLIDTQVPLIANENIENNHLGKKGLHLNKRGAGRLAMNYLSYMQRL